MTELAPDAESLGGVLGWWSWFNLPRHWLPPVISTMARALRPGGQIIIGTDRREGDHPRTRCYGDVPVEWTTHLYQPAELKGMLTDADLEIVVEILLPPQPPSQSPQIIVAAQKPSR